MRAITGFDYGVGSPAYVGTGFWNGSTMVEALQLSFDLNDTTDQASIVTTIEAAINAYATLQSYSLTEGILWLGVPPLTPRSFNNAPARSIVTGTGATGFQVSSTRDAQVSYSPKIVTTATIAGGQDGYVVLEIAATNSATAGDWKEIGRVENGQALSLAITLQSVQPVGAPLGGVVPAGWYAKLRSVNVTGTPTFSSVSGQEVLL